MHVKTIDYQTPQASHEFVNSLQETGFAVFANHPISPDLIKNVYQDWESFFKSEAKFESLFDDQSIEQSGYFPFKSEQAKGYSTKDLKEFYHFKGGHAMPQGMGERTPQLFEALLTLGAEILGWIEAGLPDEIARALSEPLAHMIQGSDMHVLRILHYPPLVDENSEGAVRASPHEDINLMTILPAATRPGLEVQDKQGKWHEVSCDQGMLVFNAGDMLERATQGFYKSTTHRVVNPVGDARLYPRYSLPLFVHPRREVQISEGCTAESYLAERLRELGLLPAA